MTRVLFGLVWLLMAVPSHADVTVRIETGEDDLRGGDAAFIRFILADGRETPEVRLSSGMGGSQRAAVRLRASSRVRAGNVRTIVIRHDGNPRSGNPLDTYDNWDLRSLKIEERGSGRRIYDHRFDELRFDFIHRFTGDSREQRINLIAPEGEPDFVIDRAARTAHGAQFDLRNQGSAPGRATHLECRGTNRSFISSHAVTLGRGERRRLTLDSFVSSGADGLICWVRGVAGETVTANNGISMR